MDSPSKSNFTIVTACTPNYAEVMRYCMPSWIKHSGAERIVVRCIAGGSPEYERAEWYRSVAARCEAMRDATLDAMAKGERVLAMDIDCIVLRCLAGGFSPDHAFSAARWPDVNMGVLFMNTSVRFDFKSFLNEMATRVRERCNHLAANPGKKWRAGDQDIWQEMLQQEERHVCKLDWHEWNFCDHPQFWDAAMGKHREKIRIAHLKGRLGMRPAPLAALAKYFKDYL